MKPCAVQRRAQETYLELNTKLERRINEVTEMQRLAEDRLRQEWVSFKTDDQKRWTGYSLSSEESFRDIRKDVQKTEEPHHAIWMTPRRFYRIKCTRPPTPQKKNYRNS